MKTASWKNVFGAILVISLLTACGKGNSTKGANSGTGVGYSPITTGNSIYDNFSRKVYNGEFAALNTNAESIHGSFKLSVQSQQKEFLGFIPYTSTSTDSETIDSDIRHYATRDYSQVRIENDSSLTSKQALINKMMGFINNTDPSKVQMDYSGAAHILTRDNVYYVIDFRYPLMANPIYKFDYKNSQGEQLTNIYSVY